MSFASHAECRWAFHGLLSSPPSPPHTPILSFECFCFAFFYDVSLMMPFYKPSPPSALRAIVGSVPFHFIPSLSEQSVSVHW